jgi:hypothetical protein
MTFSRHPDRSLAQRGVVEGPVFLGLSTQKRGPSTVFASLTSLEMTEGKR